MTAQRPNAASRVIVDVHDLEKHFTRSNGELVRAVDGVTVTVQDDEILVLLGPSGCGKTTLLRCIAGLEDPTSGSIAIDGVAVFDYRAGSRVPPNKRDVNMMFQSYALWPHMTLEDNVAYPLRITGTSKRASRVKAADYLELVGLVGLGKQYAGNISGGQQQRAALARTLISEPAVVLFDEPLSNVDAKVRNQLRVELLRLHQELKFAAVYVTHDQIEAMGLGTRIAVMQEGKIAQLDTPVEVYERPASEYVAKFVGATTLMPGTVTSCDGSAATVSTVIGPVQVGVEAGRSFEAGEGVDVMVRPEHCTLGTATAGSPNTFEAVVDSALYSGAHTEYRCLVGDQEVLVWQKTLGAPLAKGAVVPLNISDVHARIIG